MEWISTTLAPALDILLLQLKMYVPLYCFYCIKALVLLKVCDEELNR